VDASVVDDKATAIAIIVQEINFVDQRTIVIANSRLSIEAINNFVCAPFLLAACNGWTQGGIGEGDRKSQKNERGN